MKFRKNFFSIKISLYFMMLLTVTVLLISTVFVAAINLFIQTKQADFLRMTARNIYKTYCENINSDSIYFEVPYNVSYVLYNNSEEVLYSNDSFIPLLKDTNGKVKKFFIENFFSDGNLDILYLAEAFSKEEITVVAAIDIENDYEEDFFKILMKLVVIAIFPILLISFIVAAFITKRMLKPFERERQFSNDVSHELKTPLTVINGHASLLLRWGKNDEIVLNDSLSAIKKETKTMQSIIENLSQISRYESGRFKSEILEFSVRNFFDDLKEETEILCQTNSLDKNFQLSLNIDVQNDFIIKSDKELLHQVMIILITNSLKFNDYKCTITLRAEKKGKNIVFEERDDGVGIDEKIMPFIFDRFYRGDVSHSQKVPGSGLGLSIAKSIVTILRGKITVRKNSDKGVLFKIEFKE